jgi:hypothetical protein
VRRYVDWVDADFYATRNLVDLTSCLICFMMNVQQSSDPRAPGYTYGGLPEKERLGLVLWRPLFEGLADGIRSTVKTSASGVGCLVQRGSILALRAILLRHGHLFSTPQLAAILSETILPAIQSAAEADHSHVFAITSESPSVSNIDFLAKSPPLPPDHDDPALQQFGALNTIPKRPVGQAELMLEASFTDVSCDSFIFKSFASPV